MLIDLLEEDNNNVLAIDKATNTVNSKVLARFLGVEHKQMIRDICRKSLEINQGQIRTEQFIDSVGRIRSEQVGQFDERSTYLIAMSYSYELQAMVYDAWQEAKETIKQVVQTDPLILEKSFVRVINETPNTRQYQKYIGQIMDDKGIDKLADSMLYVKENVKAKHKEHFIESARKAFNEVVIEKGARFSIANIVAIVDTERMLKELEVNY